jgi:hypothetical protein
MTLVRRPLSGLENIAQRPRMPVSASPGRLGARDIAPIRIAFRQRNDVGAREEGTFAALRRAPRQPVWRGNPDRKN